MDITEIMEMRKKSYEEFEKYKTIDNLDIIIPTSIQNGYNRLGKEIISNEVCESLLDVRSIHYHNVVNKKIIDYTFPEWIVCLEEELLLEYAIPIFSRTLLHYPMLSGMNNEWEVLYLISRISREFWQENEEWKNYYKSIIEKVINENRIDFLSIAQEYLSCFEKFIK